jgi:ketosteroid isomerase-like protein
MRVSNPLAAAAALIALSFAAPAAAHPQDEAINGVYARLAASRVANDVAGMAAGFHPQALLIDARPGPAVLGADLAGVLAPQRERIVRDGVTVESAYRIERRQVIGEDLAVDAGYMRQAVRRPGAAENVRHARFLVTLKRGADGVWQIVGDAAMPSTAEVWTALAAQPGLRFDP